MSSDPQTLRNVAEVWLATAFASNVFPVNANGKFYAAMTALSLIRRLILLCGLKMEGGSNVIIKG